MPLLSNTGRMRKLLQPAFFLLVMLTSMTATASSYLQELEAEAASSDDGSNQQEEKKPSWSTQQSTENHESVEKGLTKDKFEEALKSRFYGSYLFYSTLNDTKQEVVYEEYLKNNDIEHLREVIKAQMSN